MSWKRGHWPDCYVNHGPPDATCDMGPDCGTVAPETLTDEMILEYQRSLVCSLTASSREVDDVCRDAERATGYRGAIRRDNEMAVEARQRICDAINARSEQP